MIAQGKLSLAEKMPLLGQINNFIFRFFPIMLINYLGSGFAAKLLAIIPAQVTDILKIFAGMLPLIGFMLLLKMIVKRRFELVFFVFGFVLVAAAEMQIIPVVVIAAVLAYLDFKYSGDRKEGSAI